MDKPICFSYQLSKKISVTVLALDETLNTVF